MSSASRASRSSSLRIGTVTCTEGEGEGEGRRTLCTSRRVEGRRGRVGRMLPRSSTGSRRCARSDGTRGVRECKANATLSARPPFTLPHQPVSLRAHRRRVAPHPPPRRGLRAARRLQRVLNHLTATVMLFVLARWQARLHKWPRKHHYLTSSRRGAPASPRRRFCGRRR